MEKVGALSRGPSVPSSSLAESAVFEDLRTYLVKYMYVRGLRIMTI